MHAITSRCLAVAFASLTLVGCGSGGGESGGVHGRSLVGRADASMPDGLYGVTDQGELVYVDPETAEARRIGPIGLNVGATGADFSCDGTFWAFSASSSASGAGMLLYTADLATGAGTAVKFFPGASGSSGFEFGPDEVTPYWISGAALSRLDVAAGTVERVATLPNGGGVSLTVPATCDGFLAGISPGIDRIDPVTFDAVNLMGTGGVGFTTLAATPDGRLFGDSGTSLYRIDLAAGAMERVGTITDGDDSFTLLGMAYGPRGVCCAAPDCAAARAVTPTLWPPDHAFFDVGIDGVVSASGAPVSVAVTGVRQDEPVDARGDGSTGPDAVVSDGGLRLRAERAGGGNGRVYHVSFTATANSASCAGAVAVCVPHDRADGGCVDEGPLFDSTVP